MDRQGLHELAIAARKSSPRAPGKRKHNGIGALISASLFAVPICDSQATPTTLETLGDSYIPQVGPRAPRVPI
jgi:hypothetical protein